MCVAFCIQYHYLKLTCVVRAPIATGAISPTTFDPTLLMLSITPAYLKKCHTLYQKYQNQVYNWVFVIFMQLPEARSVNQL